MQKKRQQHMDKEMVPYIARGQGHDTVRYEKDGWPSEVEYDE